MNAKKCARTNLRVIFTIIHIVRFWWRLVHAIKPVLLYIMHYCHLVLNISHTHNKKWIKNHKNQMYIYIYIKMPTYITFQVLPNRPTTSLSFQIPMIHRKKSPPLVRQQVRFSLRLTKPTHTHQSLCIIQLHLSLSSLTRFWFTATLSQNTRCQSSRVAHYPARHSSISRRSTVLCVQQRGGRQSKSYQRLNEMLLPLPGLRLSSPAYR